MMMKDLMRGETEILLFEIDDLASVISGNYVVFVVFDVERRREQQVFRVDLSVCLCNGF